MASANGAGGPEDHQQNPSTSSYIDYSAFLDPEFSAHHFANSLVHSTNNPTDTPLDLSTPLSRVLFDVQEVDTHIDALTSRSALPLLEHTREHVGAGSRVLEELEGQVKVLAEAYERLRREVVVRWESAQETRVVAERVWRTVKLGRCVGRCLTLGRQLEAQMGELAGGGGGGGGSAAAAGTQAVGKKEDHRAMVRAANTVISLRQIFSTATPGGEAEDLDRITVIRTLRAELIEPAEKRLTARAEQVVGQFSMSALTGAANAAESTSTSTTSSALLQPEDTRSRAVSALTALYLLSPVLDPSNPPPPDMFEPARLISALQEYLRRAITSSVAGLAAALAALPKLDRALIETSARCQNVVALEMLLEGTKAPEHPLLRGLEEKEDGADVDSAKNGNVHEDVESKQTEDESNKRNLLRPLLISLDTSSLPSYFWRSMASQLSARTAKIMREGGVSARTLRSNKEKVREAIRECVVRGSRLPVSRDGRSGVKRKEDSTGMVGNWEREAAVMVGSVLNAVGR
ncbi:MAG: hypothetical protein M1831_005250 [Alyxoria varia]|nr:MAG: hypothetical protein M1831_005250 [Alyxoria varia]